MLQTRDSIEILVRFRIVTFCEFWCLAFEWKSRTEENVVLYWIEHAVLISWLFIKFEWSKETIA